MTASPGRLPWRRRIQFAGLTMVLAVGLTLPILVAADLYAHHRTAETAGLNVWGYRGPLVGARVPGEVRIAFLGGSTMFGYGVRWEQALPAVVERELGRVLTQSPRVRSLNLAYNNEGAYSFQFTLPDYAWLDYDVVVLYEGYNDLGDPDEPNRQVFRHGSSVYRLTGYFPILPLVLREKAMALRAGGDVIAAYKTLQGDKTVFRPPLPDRAAASALETVSRVAETMGRQVGRLTERTPARPTPADTTCEHQWAAYCEAIHVAVTAARRAGKPVAVVGQPRAIALRAEPHGSQQAALREMLQREFGDDDMVVYLDLSNGVDLTNVDLCYDGMHLTVKGNEQQGAALARALAPLVRRVAVNR